MSDRELKTITIHQPEYLVWLGFIHRISLSGIFVVMDAVQYIRHSVEKRNKIRTSNGWQWLIVPVKKHSLKTEIKDVEISYNDDWQKNHLRAIELAYGKARFFGDYYPGLKKIISSDYRYLSDLNCDLLKFLADSFGVKTEFVKMSELNISRDQPGDAKCLEICQKLGADAYIAGPGSRKYLDVKRFEENNIEVRLHDFKHPVYTQLFEPFIPNMSSIDLLFNHGRKSMSIIEKFN